MKGLLRNISKLITVLSAVFVFICGFCNYKISAAEYDATYDPAPVEGYHKVKNGNEYYCDHNLSLINTVRVHGYTVTVKYSTRLNRSC